MKKVALLLMGITVAILMSGCEGGKKELQEIDGLVYTFIVGKVEANDDLLSEVLVDDAEGILKAGRHEFPGAADKMGERYSIKRYSKSYKEGYLFYEIEFYRPHTNRVGSYNVLVVNTEDGWLIADNSSLDRSVLESGTIGDEGTLVHEYKRQEGAAE